jgi:hypothetical protein
MVGSDIAYSLGVRYLVSYGRRDSAPHTSITEEVPTVFADRLVVEVAGLRIEEELNTAAGAFECLLYIHGRCLDWGRQASTPVGISGDVGSAGGLVAVPLPASTPAVVQVAVVAALGGVTQVITLMPVSVACDAIRGKQGQLPGSVCNLEGYPFTVRFPFTPEDIGHDAGIGHRSSESSAVLELDVLIPNAIVKQEFLGVPCQCNAYVPADWEGMTEQR